MEFCLIKLGMRLRRLLMVKLVSSSVDCCVQFMEELWHLLGKRLLMLQKRILMISMLRS
jgi:hypothetical protein